MSAATSSPPLADTDNEVSGLIELLHATDRHLEKLLGGEVDSVSDRTGRTMLLQRAQGHARDSDAAKQAAILSALPANIALLDHEGIIDAVNEGWRRFAFANVLQAPGHGIGVNYLDVCDSAAGNDSTEAKEVALGIRAVLAGATKTFSLEYACRSPVEERWFQMTVTPLSDRSTRGAVVMHVDITERRRAADALARLSTSTERRERMLSTMLSSISDLAYLFDRNGQFLFVNQKLLDLWGIPLEAAVGKNFYELGYLPDLAARLQRQVQSVFDTHESITDETIYLSPTGHLGYYEYIFSAALAADGNMDFVVGVSRDVTERKQTEEALRTSEAELRTLAECMPQIVWITRADGWCIYFNQRWVDYTGLPLEESIGHEWLKPFHPDDQQRAWDAWQQATTTHGTYSIETRLRKADGEYRWWLIRGVPLLDADGRILKWIGTCTDVHDLKQAELRLSDANKALSESERRFSELLLAVQLLSMMLDRDGRITFCNDYLLKLTGWRRDEVIGHNWFEVFQPHAGSGAMDNFEAILATTPGSWEDENEIVTRAGNRRLIRWSNSILRSAAGEVIGAASIGEDVTEHRRDRAALRELNAELEDRVQARTAQLNLARQEADQANQAKSSFLAAMSHEIRTPMNGVMGMIEVLQQTSLRGQQTEMVSLIQDSAESLLGIINDILDFSKIEAGMLDIVTNPMRLGEAVERGCSMLAPLAMKQGVRVAMFIDPEIPPIVLGDEGRFRQVLLNLLGNAIKFSGGREQTGQVSVRALLVDRQSADVAVDLVVADNGIGMDEETAIRVFTPFSQADASTTRRFGGTGLGLPISDMLVRLMGGQLSVRSALGVGTTFTVHLRFPTPAVRPDAGGGATEIAGLRCRLVGGETQLVDDLGAYLRHAGAAVTRVSNLAAAAAAERAEGLTLWLILPGQHVPPLADLRAMASDHANAEVRFVVVRQGAGGDPRCDARDLVTLEATLLAAPGPLFRAVALAAGRTQQKIETNEPERNDASVEPPVYYEAKQQGRLILVAEDNETNRKVILHQLHLVGFAAEVCRNGREAFERWLSGDFALVLTDLNMPEMDGYELATAIRGQSSSRRHTPIIALTANALREEELRCHAAGMDAYLTKPLRLAQLKAAIEVWLGPAPAATSPASMAPAVDLRVLMNFVGSNPTIIAEVLQAFRKSATDCGAEIDHAVGAGSMQGVADAAHRLKSAARSVGGNRLGQLCADLEDAARTRHGAELDALLHRFRSELQAVQGFLAAR
ncbi:MAG: PAS domain S-box protein [Gammaproteobacteria bacterium]